MVAGVFVERKRGGEYVAARIWYAHHLQIALEQSVLSWGSMNGDIREIERMLHAPARKRKIILVYRTSLTGCEVFLCSLPFRKGVGVGYPFFAVQPHDSDVVPLLVHEGVQTGCGTERHVMFAAVASRDNGYISFHLNAKTKNLANLRLFSDICK